MKKYQACKELKHRVYVHARTAKRVLNHGSIRDSTKRIAKTLIRLIFVKRYFLNSRHILFLKKVNGLVSQSEPSIQGRHRRYDRFGYGRAIFLAKNGFYRTTFFAEYAFLVGSFFQFPLDFFMR